MPSERAVARAESAWRVLALRLSLTGEHCSWFKDWYARALDAERQEETTVVWAAAQMVVAKVAIDIQAFLDGPFKIGLETACEEIVERMKDGPDSLTSTQDAGVIRARAAALGETK